MSTNAVEIGSRFRDEQEYIERYVRLLGPKTTLHDRQVTDLNRILKRVRCKPLPTRRYDRISEPYSQAELSTLLAAIKAVEPEVYQTILGHEQSLDCIPSFGLDGPAAEYMDRLHVWVDYFVPMLSDDPEEDDTEGMLRNAFREALEVEEKNDEKDRIPPNALKSLLGLAMDHAQQVWFRQRVDAMVYAREQFDEIEVLARMATPDAEINVLRQGFLLLMTAFDAAITDLTRFAFRKRFFELIGVFGKQEKISLQSLGEAGSFEAFREQMIEEQLKKRYVKELLGLIHGQGVTLVGDQDKQVQLVEMVQRRNIHVHGRGVVDERYLDTDPNSGKPRLNLYGLELGQVACIDETYLTMAHRLCRNCVERLVQWAKS